VAARDNGLVKRIDRLPALVAQLRASAPDPCTAGELARQFEVSTRTIERDVIALQRSGVPVWSTPGPMGGYTIDAGEALPLIGLTVAEVAALALAFARQPSMPYAHAARTARAKLVAALSASAVEGAQDLGTRLALLPAPEPVPAGVARIVEQAVLDREVLAITVADPGGAPTEHEVDPLALAGGDPHWYLVAWCRPAGPERSFRLDRITAVRPTGHDRPAGLPLAGDRFAALVRAPERSEAGRSATEPTP
jgi:predicted DNA-binding transcriptional regulator YafY